MVKSNLNRSNKSNNVITYHKNNFQMSLAKNLETIVDKNKKDSKEEGKLINKLIII